MQQQDVPELGDTDVHLQMLAVRARAGLESWPMGAAVA
jgi:hypothetical protein